MSRPARCRTTNERRPTILHALRFPGALILVLMATFAAAPVEAATGEGSAGITPATVDFSDPPLIPAGSNKGTLQFQQGYDRPVEVAVSVVSLNGDWHNARPWIELTKAGTMRLDPGNHLFPFTVNVPPTAPNGLYKAGVQFVIDPPEVDAYGGSGAKTQMSVTATLVMRVDSENQVKRVAVQGAPHLENVEVGDPLRLKVPLSNTGNVDADPRVRLEILDQGQTEVLRVVWFNETWIAPGGAEDMLFLAPDLLLEKGQYWARVTVELDGQRLLVSDLLTFDVLAEGALARLGELRRVGIEGNMTQVPAGTPLRVTAVVDNIGEAPLVAVFHGEVWRDGELVEMIQTPPREIGVGTSGTLHTLYTPVTAGAYEIKGFVAYDGKVTEERSVLLQVTESPVHALPAAGVPLVVGIVLLGAWVATRWRSA